ncbi:MAG TPA: hypothetical protein PKH07_14115, partial [bacterium]|nr:hypothetical protein [bacterium]
MRPTLTRQDRFGFVHPALDAHTLGISSMAQILAECGFESVQADATVCEAVGALDNPASIPIIERWLRDDRITALGFSYRLDPEDGAAACGRLVSQMKRRRLFTDQGGTVK